MKRNRKNKLPYEYEFIYKRFYDDYAFSKSFARKIAAFFESWYHKKIAKMGFSNHDILEVGCGGLNHIKYEKNFKKYDVVEPKKYLIESANNDLKLAISEIYDSIELIPKNKKYNKIISIAVLEHVLDLEEHIKKISTLLKPNGFFALAIPAEGEFLWWLAWRCSTGLAFWLKYKLDYGVLMKYEHVNDARQIMEILKKYFYIEQFSCYPCKIRNFRLYIALKCRLNTNY